jgi:transcriptional regulator with XRE-family HTH domain
MSLREVEDATRKAVSNAYLSQLETGKIAKPSPNVLHALASVYGVSYAKLMERAGYVSTSSRTARSGKHGRAATFSVENLSAEEEAELLKYLSWYRSTRGGS